MSCKPTIKKAVFANKSINKFCDIGVKIHNVLQQKYFDKNQNLSYKTFSLEELSLSSNLKKIIKIKLYFVKKAKKLEIK